MKFGAFAITFERPDDLRRTLEIVGAQTARPEVIWIIDNSGSRAVEDMVALLGRDDVRYHRMGHNAGPAGAAAAGLKLLRREGFEWAYWIDDDDPPRFPDTLERLVALIQSHPQLRVGGVATVGQRFCWKRGVLVRIPDDELTGAVSVDFVAGGQQFVVRTAAAEEVGWLESDLFFSYEDLDLCLRLRRAGYTLLVDGDRMRDLRRVHGRLGDRPKKGVVPRRQPSTIWRDYYSTRNYIHLMRSHDREDLAVRGMLRALAKAAASWARGPRFGSAYSRAALRGVVDGFRGHLGLVVPPVTKAR